ncbi:MAG: ABC transporter substrate-binding protein [Deltaproteobacteria bacterium]|nr:ABC transporter substrate-binding protein [Deltaproteobacteria bacterium]
MAKLTLSLIAPPGNERIQALMDGTIQPEGVELITTKSIGAVTFWRQLRFQEFDVAAMSITSFTIAKTRGLDIDLVAIPVFPSGRFMQTELSYHVDSGIKEPKDLVGKRIGIQEYQQTASVWVRGILEHDFGVSQYKVHWHMERDEELSHGGATGFTPPKGISFQRVPRDKSLASMLVNNEIDVASVHKAFDEVPNVVDKSTRVRGREGDWSKVRPLFPDPIVEGARFFKKHGYIPANNIYVIRGELYRKHPWIAFNLYDAFMKAKDWAREHLREMIPNGLIFGRRYLAMTREIVGDDPFPYGVKANRKMLETLIEYTYEQGLIPQKPKIEDLFVPNTWDL